MQFHSIRMKGFKKYSDSAIDFTGGLNVFYGPNEAGKSTLHQALITGLYGLGRRADDGLLRSKGEARSWQGGDECTIELEYSIENQRFVIRRDLDAGKVQLYKVSSDGERFLVSENREEVEKAIVEQTGIESAYVFNRTISVCQADLAQSSDLKRIGANIESVFAGAASISASDAAAWLDKNVRKPLRKVRNESPGELDNHTERLEKLISEIDRARSQEQHREELAYQIEVIDHRLPQKKTRLEELVSLIAKAESRSRIDTKLESDRRRFDNLEERIRKIEECNQKLTEIEEDLKDLGPMRLFDPDELDTARTQLERNRAELDAKASSCVDRIQGMQKRMKAAEELAGQIAALEQKIGEYGKLASDDLDRIDARRRELVEKMKAAELRVREQNDRLEHIEHSLWGLEQFASKYPQLGDAWALQSEWQRLSVHRDEHKRTMEQAKAELATHEANRLPPTFGNLLVELPLPLAFIGVAIAAILSDALWIRLPLTGAAIGMLIWWIMWKNKRRAGREQWRSDHRRLQEAVSSAENQWREVSTKVSAFTSGIGVSEDRVSSFIDEYRSNQNDLVSLRREHEQCLKEQENAINSKDEAEKDSRRLSEEFGCTNLTQLRDRHTELRELRREVDKLSERLAGVLGLEKLDNPQQMLMSARGTLVDLQDQKKKIENEQMDLARQETEFLQRASCDDLLQLAERTRKLRGMLSSREKLEAALEAHSAGKTLEQIKSEQRELTMEIKVAVTRLEEDFAGFEPTAEQVEFWRKERERLDSEIPEMTNKLTESRTELRMLEERAEASSAELEGEKAYIEAEIARGDMIVTACSIAVKVLEEVEQEHHNVYLPQLEENAGKHFARMTGGGYQSVNLVERWPQAITALDRNQREVEAEKLSRGTADQLYFALRLSLAQALSGRTILPLILDDPFVNFDAERFDEAIGTISSLVKEGCQVMYLTHSPVLAEREEQLKAEGLDIRTTKLGE